MPEPVRTPDNRYIVVRGRLWRAANPHLPDATRERYVSDLMDARRAVKKAMAEANKEAEHKARQAVNAAKHALGERGPVWWNDGAPDLNKYMIKNTPYADWYENNGER